MVDVKRSDDEKSKQRHSFLILHQISASFRPALKNRKICQLFITGFVYFQTTVKACLGR